MALPMGRKLYMEDVDSLAKLEAQHFAFLMAIQVFTGNQLFLSVSPWTNDFGMKLYKISIETNVEIYQQHYTSFDEEGWKTASAFHDSLCRHGLKLCWRGTHAH